MTSPLKFYRRQVCLLWSISQEKNTRNCIKQIFKYLICLISKKQFRYLEDFFCHPVTWTHLLLTNAHTDVHICIPRTIHTLTCPLVRTRTKRPLCFWVTVVVTKSPPLFFHCPSIQPLKSWIESTAFNESYIKRMDRGVCGCMCMWKKSMERRKTEKPSIEGCLVLSAQQKNLLKAGKWGWGSFLLDGGSPIVTEGRRCLWFVLLNLKVYCKWHTVVFRKINKMCFRKKGNVFAAIKFKLKMPLKVSIEGKLCNSFSDGLLDKNNKAYNFFSF